MSLIGHLAAIIPSISYADFDHAHALWGKVLNSHVVVATEGNRVQYGKLKENTTDLDSYLKNLDSVGLEEFTPYMPMQLDRQLEDATRNFLKDQTKNKFDPEKMELHLSNIFKWYAADFEKASGTVNAFIVLRLATSKEEEKRIARVKVKFLDYDWSLNGQ